MRAIEINAKTDVDGYLKLNYPLHKNGKNVRIIILVDDNNDVDDDEKLWLNAISSNPAFDFLSEPEENIYSIKDGEPFNDKK
jgi:5,10-methylene-tetrahydrofolate dehydrogenase/methenyl tetrahydrofolate cyclohydrolase